MVDKDQRPPAGPATEPEKSVEAGQKASSPASSSVNNRKSPRRRVLKEGKVIFAKGHCILDCAIDNVSEGGAHIRITGAHGVPQEFYLAEATRGVIHKAEVMWRNAAGMGLRILGPIEDATQREAFLRKFRR